MKQTMYSKLGVAAILLLALVVPGALAADLAPPGYIVVGIAPVAQFDAYYAFSTIPTKVTFIDNSYGTEPMTYLWDFGDGTTSTEQSPSHMYLQRGTYTVSLTVKNAYGSSTETKKNFISIGVAPRADFSAAPTSGDIPLSVKFADKSIGQVTRWIWNFGDGRSSSEQNPTHTYERGGVYNVILTVSNEYGSSDMTKPEYITVYGALKSKFVADPESGKAPLTVQFSDRSTGDPTGWSWDFGDGSTSTQQNPAHIFTTAGSFDVKLTVSRSGKTDASTRIINIGGVPNADFSATPLSVNVDEPVAFTDKTTNSPTAWAWEFGDTATSTTQNPSHSYQAKGIYTVSLTARNINGKDTETKASYINVGIAPKADFMEVIAPYERYKVPMAVDFIDRSSGLPTSWQWEFGDGATATEQNPGHVYAKEGVYTVKLTAKNAFGQDTMVKTGLIVVGKGLAVDFVADKTTVGVGRYVTFTDLSTNSPTNWVWEFGDGTTGTGSKPDHVYHDIGVYDVTLTASNPDMVNTQTKYRYITVLNIPRADFMADKTRGGAPMDVRFTDLSTGSPTSWTWDFGDGASSTSQNPVHSYTVLGTYTVKLTVSNANGQDTTSKTGYIVATLAPVADFKADRHVGKAPFLVQFTDLSTGKPSIWAWEFGDGTGSSEQNPSHLYLKEGAYDVRLTVTNQYGSDSVLKTGTSAPASAAIIQPAAPVQTAVPVTTKTSAAATQAATTEAVATTSAPLSPFVTVLASVIGLAAIAVASRK